MQLKKIMSSLMLATLLSFFGVNLVASEKININTANAETLQKELSYIGPSVAKRIVEYREKNGKFKSVDDLMKVKRIGKKVLNENREKITID